MLPMQKELLQPCHFLLVMNLTSQFTHHLTLHLPVLNSLFSSFLTKIKMIGIISLFRSLQSFNLASRVGGATTALSKELARKVIRPDILQRQSKLVTLGCPADQQISITYNAARVSI